MTENKIEIYKFHIIVACIDMELKKKEFKIRDSQHVINIDYQRGYCYWFSFPLHCLLSEQFLQTLNGFYDTRSTDI